MVESDVDEAPTSRDGDIDLKALASEKTPTTGELVGVVPAVLKITVKRQGALADLSFVYPSSYEKSLTLPGNTFAKTAYGVKLKQLRDFIDELSVMPIPRAWRPDLIDQSSENWADPFPRLSDAPEQPISASLLMPTIPRARRSRPKLTNAPIDDSPPGIRSAPLDVLLFIEATLLYVKRGMYSNQQCSPWDFIYEATVTTRLCMASSRRWQKEFPEWPAAIALVEKQSLRKLREWCLARTTWPDVLVEWLYAFKLHHPFYKHGMVFETNGYPAWRNIT